MRWGKQEVNSTLASKIYYINCRVALTIEPTPVADAYNYSRTHTPVDLPANLNLEASTINVPPGTSTFEASPFFSPNSYVRVTRLIVSTLDSVRTSSLDPLTSSLPAATVISPPSAPTQYTQHSSSSTVETTKLIIGLAVAITVLVLLVTIGLASFYIVRKRRRRKRETITAHQAVSNTNGERHNPQMYLQQKVELDDEQRRHEMEATDTRYELEGADEIREMPTGERERRSVRQELSGERLSKGLDKPS